MRGTGHSEKQNQSIAPTPASDGHAPTETPQKTKRIFLLKEILSFLTAIAVFKLFAYVMDNGRSAPPMKPSPEVERILSDAKQESFLEAWVSTGDEATIAGMLKRQREGEPSADYSKAMTYYRMAAKQNYAPAQYDIGELYERGEGVPVDYHEAMQWYRKAAKQSLPLAYEGIARLYLQGGHGVAQDSIQGRLWMQKAADGGDKDAKLWVDRNRGN